MFRELLYYASHCLISINSSISMCCRSMLIVQCTKWYFIWNELWNPKVYSVVNLTRCANSIVRNIQTLIHASKICVWWCHSAQCHTKIHFKYCFFQYMASMKSLRVTCSTANRSDDGTHGMVQQMSQIWMQDGMSVSLYPHLKYCVSVKIILFFLFRRSFQVVYC